MTTGDTLLVATDPRDRQVRCSREWWNEHIVRAQGDHLELQDQEDRVKETIEKPEAIYLSGRIEDREVYYRSSTLFPGLYIRVVVGFRDPEGFVVTAMHVDGPDPREVLIWP